MRLTIYQIRSMHDDIATIHALVVMVNDDNALKRRAYFATKRLERIINEMQKVEVKITG